MPTTRQRYQITETDALAECLDKAAEKWPDVARSKLLVQLALAGAQVSFESPVERALKVQVALTKLHESLGDLYKGVTVEEIRGE
ncbi:MAG: hypothetical protein PHN51_04575 [Candidatus Nanopelagicales bacterium]|nr:hypothetical protein [Candidatus Nanopelagicales bacterium]